MKNAEIPKYIEEFFLSFDVDQRLNRFSFFLIRQDGVILYQNKKDKLINTHSIGALLGGVWQASHALSEFIPSKSKEVDYRLSFDTSSDGIYIVPIDTVTDKFYLGLIYYNELNPGFLKSKIRDIATSLAEYLLMQKVVKKDNLKIEKPLFENITDAEMDRIFSFAKN